MRAKEKVVFARTEVECSKEKVKEEAYDLGVAETQATLKAQVPGVCRLYCSQVWNGALKQAGVEASSDLWKAERCTIPLPSGMMPPLASRSRMLKKRLRLPAPELLWQ